MPAPLGDFQVLQEVSGYLGRKTYLARSKGGNLVLVRELGSDIGPEDGSRFSKQVSLGARLSSDAILQTRSLLLQDRYAAIVTELVPGVLLQRLLRFATGRGVRLPDVCALHVLERVLTALASAHHSVKDPNGMPRPIVHGMLLPSSVVVGWDGTVKVADFGLDDVWRVALRGDPAGPYGGNAVMAPEVAKGGRADARSDVYHAGLLAVRLLTGRTPFARFDSKTERTIAMVESDVARLAKTRPDLPAPLRNAVDSALEPDHDQRTFTAEAFLAVVRQHVDGAAGKAALAKLLGRWRRPLEAKLTPWEARASLPDDVPEEATGLVKEGMLALLTRDESPSDPALVASPGAMASVPREEVALAPTDPVTSLSRLGSIAPDALVMPLPAMRITMPSLPTYGGPAVNVPRPPPKRGVFTGKVAAAVVATMFIVLVAGTVILFRWLLHR